MGKPLIRAIQTRYKGYYFRSRTEARWAVFFDALGLNWVYELDGFDLSGTWYLPDFWLQKEELWIEIKGTAATSREREKAMRLANQLQKKVLVLVGQPWSGEHSITMFIPNAVPEHNLSWDEINGALCLARPDGIRIEVQKPHFQRQTGREFYKDTELTGSALERAFNEARAARFSDQDSQVDSKLKALSQLIYLFQHHNEYKIPLISFLSEAKLKYLGWRDHIFVLFPGSEDKVGCVVIRNKDLSWRWFEVEWQLFMRKNPFSYPGEEIDDVPEHDYLKSVLSRKIRKNPIAFFKKLGIEVAIVWKNLGIAIHIKNDLLELIVLRLTDGCWWSVPFHEEMFDQI